MTDLCVGRSVIWRQVASNYGHVLHIPGIVKRIGKRVTIEVTKMNGDKRCVSVKPENLRAPSVTPGRALTTPEQ